MHSSRTTRAMAARQTPPLRSCEGAGSQDYNIISLEHIPYALHIRRASCSSTYQDHNPWTTFTWVSVVVRMSRKHMEQSGYSQYTTDMLNQRCMICSACKLGSAIWSIQKLVSQISTDSLCLQHTQMPRSRDLVIFVQTYRPITSPLVHAPAVCTQGLDSIYMMTSSKNRHTSTC